MTDTSKPSHWQDLAQQIGADVGAAKAPPKPAPAATPQPPRRTHESSRPVQRPAADWSALASELGATPAPMPPRRPERPVAARPAPPAEREEPRREARPPSRPPQERPEPPRFARPQQFEREAPVIDDEVAEVAGPFVVEEIEEIEFIARISPEPTDEPREAEGERPSGRRRRRRRRGRGRSGDRPQGPPREPEVWDVESAPARPMASEPDDMELLSEPPAGEERSEEPGRGEGKGRSRRRRRRRGGRRNGESREPAAARSEDAPQMRSRTDDDVPRHAEDEDDFDIQPSRAAELEQAAIDDDDDGELKTNHRGIPTWDDAIGMIISTNMEARAKNPSGPSHQRGRRGQNRGRSHGR